MKKALILSTLLAVASLNAQAATLKEGALYCINSKKIIAYYDYLEMGQDKFAQKLMDNADCFIKGRDEGVIVRSENKNHLELELFSCFKVWTKKENVVR